MTPELKVKFVLNVAKNQITMSRLSQKFEVKAVTNSKWNIILPESWTRGLVKKRLNLTKRYDQTNPTQIHA